LQVRDQGVGFRDLLRIAVEGARLGFRIALGEIDGVRIIGIGLDTDVAFGVFEHVFVVGHTEGRLHFQLLRNG
jgi:hypothetical protein